MARRQPAPQQSQAGLEARPCTGEERKETWLGRQWWQLRVARTGRFDIRSLLLWRTAVGMVIAWDSHQKAHYAHAFYENVNSSYPRFALEEDVGWFSSHVNPFTWCDGVRWPQFIFFCRGVAGLGLQRSQKWSLLCWFLTTCATLRNVDMTYIFDRYVHVMLVFSCSLPFTKEVMRPSFVAVLLRLQLAWIYIDAGLAKIMDHSGDWSFQADVPALAVYMNGASFMAPLLDADRDFFSGLVVRAATPVIAWLEFLVGPAMLVASLGAAPGAIWPELFCLLAVLALHLGIASTMESGSEIALIAIASWLVILPSDFWNKLRCLPPAGQVTRVFLRTGSPWIAYLFMGLCCMFHLSGAHGSAGLWPSVFLYNRWTVFPFADKTVTWTVVPAKLANNSRIDLWSWEQVNFQRPQYGRKGRWMAFPANKPATEAAENARFDYLCKEWNAEHDVKVLKFQYYEVMATFELDRSLSPPSKYLVRAHTCD